MPEYPDVRQLTHQATIALVVTAVVVLLVIGTAMAIAALNLPTPAT